MKMKSILVAAFALMSVLAQATPTAKAVYNADTKTLTLYYDELSHEGEGEVCAFSASSGWSCSDAKANATQVVVDASMADLHLTSCASWFYYYGKLSAIKGIEYLDTSKVTSFRRFLRGAAITGILDLTTFDTSSATDMREMFSQLRVVETIYVSDKFVTDNVTQSGDMFTANAKLVGGKGTSFSADNPLDKTYARIDGGVSAPGYFSEKNPHEPPAIDSVVVSDVFQTKAKVTVAGENLQGGGVSVELRHEDSTVAQMWKTEFCGFDFTGLTESTQYDVIVIATNRYGAVTNDTQTFTTLAPAGENWEYDVDAGTISWGGWTFAATVKDGTTEMTVGAVQAWPDQVAPLDFSRTVVADGVAYTIVILNPQFGHQDKASGYAPEGYAPKCLRVGQLTLPGEGLEKIATGAFAGCVNASGVVVLPSTLTAIGEASSTASSVFSDCENLTVSGAFPGGLTKIGQYAFRNVNIQGELNITSAVLVADSAFQNSTVGSVVFGPNLTTIGGNYKRGAFQGCAQLTNLVFDAESSYDIAYGFTFCDCTGLVEIDFKGLKTLKLANATTGSNYGHFGGCTSLRRINFGSKIETVWTNAIAGATALEEVVFEGVPPTDMQLPLFSAYSGAKTFTTRIHRKYASVTNANGVAWTDYAANGKIEYKGTTWATEYAGVADLSKRPLLTLEKGGLVLLIK